MIYRTDVTRTEPALEVLRHDLVEGRLLGPSPLVAAGRRGAAMWPASDSRGKPCDRGDHGRTGGWTACVNGRTLSAGRGGSPPANRNAREQEQESWACPVELYEDQWILPTVSVPLIPTIAFFWERLGVEKDAAMCVLREAIAEAIRAKTDESPSIKSKMDDVAEAVAAVKRDLIEVLPKMRRAGRTDVSDLKVSVNALTPVSEPLYAVA